MAGVEVKENIEQWPIDKFIEYARNPRKNDHAVDRIASAINEFGFKVPIIAKSDGSVVDGHLRLKAARKLKLDTLPVLLADDLTDAQIKAFRLSINKMAEIAEWDDEMLALELEELQELDFDLDLIGFDQDELDALLTNEVQGLTDDDVVPDVPDDPISKRGDIWLLGNHRVMCGDSTSVDDVEKLMDGKKADFCFTSPPYSQQRDYENKIDDWDALMDGVFSILPVKDGAQVLVNLGLVHEKKEWTPYWDKWIDKMRSLGWLRFALYVWDQGSGMMGEHNGRLAPSFELIFHFCMVNKSARKTKKSKHAGESTAKSTQRKKDGTVKKLYGAGNPINKMKVCDSVIRVNRQLSRHGADNHPAPFPCELCDELSLPWAKVGDICYEPFAGSGTQLISNEKNGFISHSMELSEKYCDVIVTRWQEFTGKQAILESTGEPFTMSEVA